MTKINDNKKIFIIAEAGVNHNASLKLAKKMVDKAKEAGADAVKFQAFKAEDLVVQDLSVPQYQIKSLGRRQTQSSLLKKLEMEEKDFEELKKHCQKKKILFLCSPHTAGFVDFLSRLVPAFKTASGDLTNIPLLEKIARKKKWMIISTGMGNLKEIEEALRAIRKISKKKISLLQCTSVYPCPFEDANLLAMKTLEKKFAGKFRPLEIGFSDHTKGIAVSLAAAALGAKVIEKHFTLSRNLKGPDHASSVEPAELKEMVQGIRNIEKALGTFQKKALAVEKEAVKVARKSIVASENIGKGEKITADKLAIKRPAKGIPPKEISKIIGKTAKINIKKDALIKFPQLK